MKARLRHWKQRFDPNAKLVAAHRLRLDAETILEYGDELTPEIRQKFKLSDHRLSKWWEAKAIMLKEFTPSQPNKPEKVEAQAPAPVKKAKKKAKKA